MFLLFITASAYAGGSYHNYLLSKTVQQHLPVCKLTGPVIGKAAVIPKYQLPKGSVFCRMEDKLTRATGIWIKIGVK